MLQKAARSIPEQAANLPTIECPIFINLKEIRTIDLIVNLTAPLRFLLL
jgi:hypothetical protein